MTVPQPGYLALDVALKAASLPHAVMPEGFVYWTSNP